MGGPPPHKGGAKGAGKGKDPKGAAAGGMGGPPPSAGVCRNMVKGGKCSYEGKYKFSHEKAAVAKAKQLAKVERSFKSNSEPGKLELRTASPSRTSRQSSQRVV